MDPAMDTHSMPTMRGRRSSRCTHNSTGHGRPATGCSPGGLMCINIGDATGRLPAGSSCFEPCPHPREHRTARLRGPARHPSKPTNSPTKFMGSGMLPAGAYVTYEHEYVLILRKGERRLSGTPRRPSTERVLGKSGTRGSPMAGPARDPPAAGRRDPEAERRISSAFPTGSSSCTRFAARSSSTRLPARARPRPPPSRPAATASASSSTPPCCPIAELRSNPPWTKGVRARDRRDAHVAFVRARTEPEDPGHHNSRLDVPVMTRQERELVLTVPTSFTIDDADTGTATHRVLTRRLIPRLPRLDTLEDIRAPSGQVTRTRAVAASPSPMCAEGGPPSKALPTGPDAPPCRPTPASMSIWAPIALRFGPDWESETSSAPAVPQRPRKTTASPSSPPHEVQPTIPIEVHRKDAAGDSGVADAPLGATLRKHPVPARTRRQADPLSRALPAPARQRSRAA